MSVLEVNRVSKSFGDFKAVSNVSFNVEKGRIYGMLGPNGAGKTTTIRMIMNILIPDSGSIRLFGDTMSDALKSRIGYMPEERGLYQKMKVKDLLAFMGELHGMPVKKAKESGRKWLERMQLADRAENKVEEFSKGMQQKLQFIGTIMHDPELVILDEPFSGLDPVNVNLFKNIMLEFREQGKAIMFSTHMMEAAEKLCDDILMIDHGQKVLDGTLQSIQTQHGKNSLRLEFSGNGAPLNNAELVSHYNEFSNYVDVELKEGVTPNQFLKHALQYVEIHRMEAQKTSLNEIFLNLAGGGKSHE
jgi:ABC-2 type transport system ATP-binding protein